MSTNASPPASGAAHAHRQGRDLSVPLGRVFGIQIRAHATFLLIVLLFAMAYSAPNTPGLASGFAWLALIFACVLIHELAHSVLARSRGATVRGIMLLPIGGVSQLEHMPETWNDELAIAAVGPATSFLLAGVAALAAWGIGAAVGPPALAGGSLLRRLVWFNLLIGAFNLLPAFPLDGGRVLRAVLERTLDRETATRRAAVMGRSLAVVIGLVGLVWDFWLVFIAVFVYFGATAEERATVLHLRAQRLHVRDVMLLEPITVDARLTGAELLSLCRRTPQRQFPVLDGGRFVGVVDADAAASADPRRAVGGLAAAGPFLAPDDPIEGEALEALTESELPALAVLQGQGVVGLLTVAELSNRLSKPSTRREGTGGAR